MGTVYKGRVFSVERAQMRFPNGRTHEVEIVRHPPSVVLIPFADEHHVILIRQFRAALNKELWELPAGSVNEGETPEEAASRECEEEIKLVPDRVERLRGLYPTPGFCDEELIFFRVSQLRQPSAGSARRADEDEDIQVRRMPIAEARAMAARGDIVDLKTAYGLTLL